MSDELRNIISGTGKIATRNLIQTALFYLRESKTTSGKIKKSELVNKKNEIERLVLFANKNHLWYQSINESTYIGEGAEQKVYLNEDGKNVIKLNDTIFYSSWEDYFISLLIHNYLFVKTSYDLIGFYQEENTFYAVVKQPFIESTEATDLDRVRLFLESNGFKHKKNNDYFNTELGIILEDLHDENVLTNKDVFFFIDSAIYLL
jgi:Serine/Threonine/Tyrosine Kinase found in polyvalent proteins